MVHKTRKVTEEDWHVQGGPVLGRQVWLNNRGEAWIYEEPTGVGGVEAKLARAVRGRGRGRKILLLSSGGFSLDFKLDFTGEREAEEEERSFGDDGKVLRGDQNQKEEENHKGGHEYEVAYQSQNTKRWRRRRRIKGITEIEFSKVWINMRRGA